jgi:adenosylmethionine-8-amino-7-oxononanoate aminotransferase
MKKVSFAHPFHWKNQPHMELTERIAAMAPSGLSHVFMCSGGSEATETALKMARQYHVERGYPSRYKVISRWNSFHGNTLGSLSMTGMPMRREAFIPILASWPHIAAQYCYRCPFGKEYPSCKILCAQDLEDTILKEGKDSIAAFIAEPVVGAAGGGLTAPPEYYRRIREICDQYDILMIVDEVITGFGRTGLNFGIQHWDVVPDIICSGKGMSSGYTPLGAAIAHDKVYDVFARSPKGFAHGYTFGGNPLSCAVGNAVLQYMEKHRLIENVRTLDPFFFSQAQQHLDLDCVGDIRGKGFFMGVEIVADRQSKRPFPADLHASRQIADIAFSKGLITSAHQGIVDGVQGDHINLAPPFTCTQADLSEIIGILREAIREFQSSLSHATWRPAPAAQLGRATT